MARKIEEAELVTENENHSWASKYGMPVNKYVPYMTSNNFWGSDKYIIAKGKWDEWEAFLKQIKALVEKTAKALAEKTATEGTSFK